MLRKIIQAIMISILSALILTIAASAQIKDDVASALVYDGVETSNGTLDEISSVRYGNTFVLRSNGKFNSRYLTVSINHRAMFKGVGVTGGAWSLNETGRKTVLIAYQKRKQEEITHPVTDRTIPISLVPHIQARLLARHIRGELETYPPFIPKV